MRAPERSRRVDKSSRTKALTFAVVTRAESRAAPAAGGSRSTPKFFGA